MIPLGCYILRILTQIIVTISLHLPTQPYSWKLASTNYIIKIKNALKVRRQNKDLNAYRFCEMFIYHSFKAFAPYIFLQILKALRICFAFPCFIYLFSRPRKARDCYRNSNFIHSFIDWSMVFLVFCRPCVAFSHKTDYVAQIQGILKSHRWFKSYSDLTEWVDIAYWWSCIGRDCACIQGSTKFVLMWFK